MSKMMSKIIIITIIHLCCLKLFNCIEVLNQWNYLQYDFTDPATASILKPEDNAPTGIEITEDRIFISVPRLRAGVGATISSIPRSIGHGPTSPVLQAYPNWSWHVASTGNYSCTALISVYRMRADSCNRLWILDSGVETSLDDFRAVCPPKIVIFDLHTNEPVHVIEFPRELLKPFSLFTNLIIDEVSQGRCDRAFVYISDTASPAIVVYDGIKKQTWRISDASMFPDKNFSEFNILGTKFKLMDGIIGLAFSEKSHTMFFQPLATNRLFSLDVRSLQFGPLGPDEKLPVKLIGKKSSQALGVSFDPLTDSLVLSPVSETAVAVWQPKTNYQKILAYEPELLQFASDVRCAEKDNFNIYLLTTRFQKFFTKTVDLKEPHIRVLRLRGIHSASNLL